jgi:hypothetical protein
MESVKTDPSDLKALAEMDSILLGPKSNGFFRKAHPEGFYELFVGDIVELARKRQKGALNAFMRIFSAATGVYGEYVEEYFYQLLTGQPEVILDGWQEIEPFEPKINLETTDFPDTYRTLLATYRKLCSSHSAAESNCKKVIGFLAAEGEREAKTRQKEEGSESPPLRRFLRVAESPSNNGKVSYLTDLLQTYGYDGGGRLATITTPNGNALVSNQYDSNGRVSQQTHADGGEWSYAYTLDGSGNVTATDIIDPNQSATHMAPRHRAPGIAGEGAEGVDESRRAR